MKIRTENLTMLGKKALGELSEIPMSVWKERHEMCSSMEPCSDPECDCGGEPALPDLEEALSIILNDGELTEKQVFTLAYVENSVAYAEAMPIINLAKKILQAAKDQGSLSIEVVDVDSIFSGLMDKNETVH
jgi:hypothetical protein